MDFWRFGWVFGGLLRFIDFIGTGPGDLVWFFGGAWDGLLKNWVWYGLVGVCLEDWGVGAFGFEMVCWRIGVGIFGRGWEEKMVFTDGRVLRNVWRIFSYDGIVWGLVVRVFFWRFVAKIQKPTELKEIPQKCPIGFFWFVLWEGKNRNKSTKKALWFFPGVR